MRRAYQVLAIVVAALVAVQGATIAFAVFGLGHDVDGGKTIGKNYDGNFGWAVHAIAGMTLVPLVALALLVISFFTRVPNGRKLAGWLFGLVVLQIGLAFASDGLPAIGLLHGLTAFAVFAVAAVAARQATPVPVAAEQPEVRDPAPTT